MNSGIYAIVSPSGKGYIGSSRKLSRRKVRHFHDLKYDRHHCEPLQRAWNKYGAKLYFIILEYCNEDDLVLREQFWLDHPIFIALYNSRLITGKHGELSEETKLKISLATKGKLKSEVTKQRMRKPKSAEHSAAISRGKKGSNGRWSPERVIRQRETVKIALEALRLKRERVRNGCLHNTVIKP